MSITRRLPYSNPGRQKALNDANDKYISLPGNDVLKATTAAQLATKTGLYNTTMQNVANAKAAYNTKTPVKDAAVSECRQIISHFIQVFNLGVARKKYEAGHRAFYHLEVSSDAVPPMITEDDVKLWGRYIVDGDAARVLAGGAPMANPDATEVAAKLAAMEALLLEHSNLADALDTLQENIENNNEQIDILIKKVWDEVESTFGSESPESKRESCREWGVVYVTDGSPAALTGLVKDGTGAVVSGATVFIKETGAETTTNAEGRYTVNTSITGEINIVAEFGLAKGQQTLTIPEHSGGINVDVGDVVVS